MGIIEKWVTTMQSKLNKLLDIENKLLSNIDTDHRRKVPAPLYPPSIEETEYYYYEQKMYVNNVAAINMLIGWLNTSILSLPNYREIMFPLRQIYTEKWFICWGVNINDVVYVRFAEESDLTLFKLAWTSNT